MSSIFHRRPQAQPTQPSTSTQLASAPSLGSAASLRQQGIEAARRLKLPYQRVLIEVAAATLDGAYEPYEPASPETARLASVLADPSIGLLLAGTAGFVTCYSLTPLGGAVVRALLHDLLSQRATVVPTQMPGDIYGHW